MIEQLLGEVVPRAFDCKPKVINVPIDKKNAPFTMSDTRACGRCQELKPERHECNNEILKVNNNGHEIAVVNWEKYVGQFGKEIKRCDLLMTESGESHGRIVFCDLCCYEEKYVEPNEGIHPEGKRAYARDQMKQSIEVLLKEPDTEHFVLTYPDKVCLFAWRDYNVPEEPVSATRRDARANVLAFATIVSAMETEMTSHHTIMNHAFTFKQIKYPAEFVWEDINVIDERLELMNEK